ASPCPAARPSASSPGWRTAVVRSAVPRCSTTRRAGWSAARTGSGTPGTTTSSSARSSTPVWGAPAPAPWSTTWAVCGPWVMPETSRRILTRARREAMPTDTSTDESPLVDFDDERPRGRRRAWVVAVVVLVLLVGGYAAAAWYFADRTPRGARVAGVDIGGLPPAEAVQRLTDGLSDVATELVPVTRGTPRPPSTPSRRVSSSTPRR